MKVRVSSVEFFRTATHTRVPFRFGAVTLRDATVCTARVTIESDLGRATGYSADLCVPKWFEKDPSKSAEDDVATLLTSAQTAAAALTSAEGQDRDATVFDHWWRTWNAVVETAGPSAPEPLARGFGVALCERALIDAVCRATGQSFDAALRADLFGIEPGRIDGRLDGWKFADRMPATPRSDITVRHTIGLADALTPSELTGDEVLEDGLPTNLQDEIRRYGLHCFKIKIGQGPEDDCERLLAIAEVLRRELGDRHPRITLDGNEQYSDLGSLLTMLRFLHSESRGRDLLSGLLYIEQPLSRQNTFDRSRVSSAISAITEDFAPIIIDEADAELDSFERALQLGYSGTSVKNCKGVFRAIAHHGVCQSLAGGAFQTSEDLTNLGVLSLQQDLATAAALDLDHTERNGHHYFHGLDHLPEAESQAAVEQHSDLYCHLENGSVSVRIDQGTMHFGSIHGAGYGTSIEPDCAAREPLGSLAD